MRKIESFKVNHVLLKKKEFMYLEKIMIMLLVK